MADRLRHATSPYLLQHADNPVDWWQWGDDAFAEARHRDVPVLLSVGYSACHWCHVMAHESFEDAATADLMNEHLVSIKLDREERPDVDAVYMTATQAMTGQGGWPMTVFLTADREPFYCGTYFPREHFQRLVLAIAKTWRNDRQDVINRARQIAAALAENAAPSERRRAAPGTADVPGRAGPHGQLSIPAGLTEAAVASLAKRYDSRRGGFGGAPKFPPSTVLEFLLRHSARPDGLASTASSASRSESASQALAMAAGTAEAMARGGIYDQLGGGFARYSVDADWVVPHFEKMLYDNAQLARIYAHWWRRSGADLARRVAIETCEWMIADLATGDGGFASALDADSDGEEGAFYVWTPAQLADLLGADDGNFAAEIFAVSTAGTFERGRSVLQLPADPADQQRYQRVRAALLAERSRRNWPARDDKVVAAWNGLAIAALAQTGLLFGRPEFVQAAERAAELLARVHLSGDRLVRTSRDGVAGASAGVLEDYACAAEGFLALSGVTGQAQWVTLAGRLLDTAMDRFRAPDGGFFDTADDAEQLIYRPADPADGPTPSGTFAVAGALLSYAALTGSARHRSAAASALDVLGDMAGRYPQAAGGLAVAEAFAAGPVEIAIVGPRDDQRTADLHLEAAFSAPPGAVIALGTGADNGDPAGGGSAGGGLARGDLAGAGLAGAGLAGGGLAGGGLARADLARADSADGGGAGAGIPLLAHRGLVNGQPAAYVCRGFTCQLPVTTPEQLRAALGS